MNNDELQRYMSHRPLARLKEGRNDWYRFENKAANVAELFIYDEIGYFGVTASDLIKDLKAQDGKRITVRINSPGGEVFDGIAILNALRRHNGGVDVVVDGLAASAASVIAMAGETITMAKQSQMMIHEGHAVAIGPASVMADMAARLDQVSAQLAEAYAERAGGTADEWRERMQRGDGRGTTYTAQEAVDAGLADKVEGNESVSNTWDLSVFAKIDRELTPIEPISGSTTTTQEKDTIIESSDIRAILKEAFSA